MKFTHINSQSLKKTLPFILPSIIFLVIVIVIKFNGLYGQDSHEYYRYTKGLIDFIKGGTKPDHFFWPVFYPLSGAVLSFIISSPLFTLQLISFLSFLFAIFFIQKVLELTIREEKNKIPDFLLLTFSISPFFILYSSAVMSDLYSIFFITGAIYFLFKYLPGIKPLHFLLFICFAALAVMARYAAAVILFIPIFLIAVKFAKNFKIRTFLSAAAIILFCLIIHFYFKSDVADSLNNVLIRNWDVINLFRSSFNSEEGSFNYNVPNTLFAFSNFVHPYFIFGGVVLLFFFRLEDFKRSELRLSLAAILIYSIFIGGIPFQNKRFLLLSFPFVLIILYHPFKRAVNFLKSKKIRILLIFFLIVIQLLIFSYVFSKIYEMNRTERRISNALLKYDNEVIYTFFIDPALRSYDVNKKIINLWQDKIQSFQKNALVLFNESKFGEQWKNKNPMINWNYLKENYQLIKLQSFDDGWELYEIE